MKKKYTIHKEKLSPNTRIDLPKGTEILTVGEQQGEVYIWFKINVNEKEMETRTFLAFGTGEAIEADVKYIDTVFFIDGLVFHFFEQV